MSASRGTSARTATAGEGRPGPATVLELAALAAGLLFALSLAAALPSWRAELGRLQALAAVAFAFYALAVARRRRWASLPHGTLAVVLVAFALRAAVVGVEPTLSDDVYRYVWDGRVLASGRLPYAHAPSDPALAPLRDALVHPHINHPELRTIYPPAAELGFAFVARLSPTVTAMKLWIALHDLALCTLLAWWCGRRGGSPFDAVAYAWNPLVVLEYAGNGHVDPVALLWMIAAFVLAERRPVASALALGVASLVKIVPLLALPFLWRAWTPRARAVGLVVIAVGLAAYAALARGPGSGLDAYAMHWSNNAALFELLARLLGDARARVAAVLLVATVIAWGLWRRTTAERGTRDAARAMLVAGPVVHPWYLGWALVFEPLSPSAPWPLLSLTALLGYGVLAPPVEGGAFHLSPAWRGVEYGVPALLAAILFATRSRRRRMEE